MPLDISLGSFYGIDSLIDFASLFVAALVSYQSRKIYKLINEKNYKFFSWAFLSIAAAFLFKIISNLTIVHRIVIENSNFVLTLVREFQEMQAINFVSFTLYKVFLVIGFLTLFFITEKTEKKREIILFTYLCIISVLLSIYFNFIFHLTVIMLLIALAIYFYENYKRTNSRNSYLVFMAFIFILVSHIIDLFYGLHPLVYITAEILVFAGFLVLLINHLKLKNDKKKNKTRSGSGHLGDIKRP